MLELLVKSPVRRKIVGLFVLNGGEELYARQVALELGESPHAVGLELHYLTKGGVLNASAWGRQTYYSLNDEYPYVSELVSIVKKMRDAGSKEMCSLPDLMQRRRIEENLGRVVADIKKYYDPEKIIIFGSAATGRVGPFSDIDLVVVKKTRLPYFRRVAQLVDLLDYDVDIDFMVYTPEEFNQAVKEKRFIKSEMEEKGRVLYEKAA